MTLPALPTVISAFAWPPDDADVILTANSASVWRPYRAELDGSDTTWLGTTGGVNQNYFKAAIVFEDRIWFIARTDSTGVGIVRSMAVDGTGQRIDFQSSLGTGNQVAPFVGGDGFYYN